MFTFGDQVNANVLDSISYIRVECCDRIKLFCMHGLCLSIELIFGSKINNAHVEFEF